MNTTTTAGIGSQRLLYQFQKYYQDFHRGHGISDVYYRLVIIGQDPKGVQTKHISVVLDALVKDAVNQHTVCTGELAHTISFKLVANGSVDVISLPYMPIDEMAAAILNRTAFHDIFIGFLQNQFLNFDLRFWITAQRSTIVLHDVSSLKLPGNLEPWKPGNPMYRD